MENKETPVLPVSLATAISRCLEAIRNCIESGNDEWQMKHETRLRELCQNHLPHGSGIDSTTPEDYHGLDFYASHSEKLTIHLSFHHMNDDGCYDGWTDHTVIVTPTFGGVDVRVTGRNRNDIKDYLIETYHCALSQMVQEY